MDVSAEERTGAPARPWAVLASRLENWFAYVICARKPRKRSSPGLYLLYSADTLSKRGARAPEGKVGAARSQLRSRASVRSSLRAAARPKSVCLDAHDAICAYVDGLLPACRITGS